MVFSASHFAVLLAAQVLEKERGGQGSYGMCSSWRSPLEMYLWAIKRCLTGTMCVQILGLVGSARKRTLVLWQAVEFSRAHEMAVIGTLQVSLENDALPDAPHLDG